MKLTLTILVILSLWQVSNANQDQNNFGLDEDFLDEIFAGVPNEVEETISGCLAKDGTICSGVGVCRNMKECLCPQDRTGVQCEKETFADFDHSVLAEVFGSVPPSENDNEEVSDPCLGDDGQYCSAVGFCNGNVCECPEGYSGSLCEIEDSEADDADIIDEIFGPDRPEDLENIACVGLDGNVCSGVGFCEAAAECVCPVGYFGIYCEECEVLVFIFY